MVCCELPSGCNEHHVHHGGQYLLYRVLRPHQPRPAGIIIIIISLAVPIIQCAEGGGHITLGQLALIIIISLAVPIIQCAKGGRSHHPRPAGPHHRLGCPLCAKVYIGTGMKISESRI